MKILNGVKEYPALIRAHKKDSTHMSVHLTPLKVGVLHNAIELATSASDLLACIKRCTLYGQALDIQTIMEELGKIEFSLEELRQVLEIQRDAVLVNNMSAVQQKYARDMKAGKEPT